MNPRFFPCSKQRGGSKGTLGSFPCKQRGGSKGTLGSFQRRFERNLRFLSQLIPFHYNLLQNYSYQHLLKLV